MTDEELVRQVWLGQTSAYEELVHRWAGPVHALCQARTRCRHTAEDLAQEALLRGLRGLSTLNEPEKFGAWICGIARRACLDWLKAKQTGQIPFAVLSRNSEPEHLLATAAEVTERAVDEQDEIEQLLDEVDALPDELREIILLYYFQEGTYADLAKLLGVSTATVNARLSRARAMLRERLGQARSR